jgi:hypothetical protein
LVELVDLRPAGAVAEVAVGDAPQAVVDPVVRGLNVGGARTGRDADTGERRSGPAIH